MPRRAPMALTAIVGFLALSIGHSFATVPGTIDQFIAKRGSQVEGVVGAPDGNIWFGDTAKARIGRISPEGVMKVFNLGTQARTPIELTIGPDGNIWFADSNGGRVGFITTKGVVTMLSNALGFPAGIAVGSDGNIWVADEEQAVYRIAATAPYAMTKFTVPGTGGPTYIASGPDGNLWFTDQQNHVDRITTTGVITRFQTPTNNSHTMGITAGPDGNVWFTELDANKIGKIAPSTGVITEYIMPNGGLPQGITTGPDGNLWFAVNGGWIGQITTSGVITQYGVPWQYKYPVDITSGADGNLWFADQSTNPGGIGRVWEADAHTRYVLANAAGDFPLGTDLPDQSSRLEWEFQGATADSVADASGLGLFDSGPRQPGSLFTLALPWAGSYPYMSSAHPSASQSITVPMLASPLTGGTGTHFMLTWGSAAAPSGCVFDVQIRRPGSSAWESFVKGASTRGASYVPDAGVGTYAFRSRLRNTTTKDKLGWSPLVSISVS